MLACSYQVTQPFFIGLETMTKNKGWVRLYRQIEDNPLWFAEPFTRAQAWIDLILLANHTDGILVIRGNVVTIKRGQIGWSQEKLAERWRWSRGKLKRFIKYLEMIQQIEQQQCHAVTLLTIKNYCKYQSDDTTDSTTDSTTDGHQTVQQTDTNKNVNNVNNVNNDNNKYSLVNFEENVNTTPDNTDVNVVNVSVKKKRFIPPSLEEIKSYILEKQYTVNPDTFFNYFTEGNWIDSKGNKVRNWKQKLITWERKNYGQPGRSISRSKQPLESEEGKEGKYANLPCEVINVDFVN